MSDISPNYTGWISDTTHLSSTYIRVKFRHEKCKFRAKISSDHIKRLTFSPFRDFEEYDKLVTSCAVAKCKTARIRSILLPTLAANARSGSTMPITTSFRWFRKLYPSPLIRLLINNEDTPDSSIKSRVFLIKSRNEQCQSTINLLMITSLKFELIQSSEW